MKPKIIIVLVLIGLCIIILAQNAQVVTLRFLFWEIGLSQIVVLPLAMFLGFIIGVIFAKIPGTARSKKKSR